MRRIASFLVLFVFVFTLACKSRIDRISSDIRLVYEKYPSLRTHLTPSTLKQVAPFTIGEIKANEIMQLLEQNIEEFQKAHLSALRSFSQDPLCKRAVVSGQSITGMIAAAILANSGYRVDTYDVREEYTRNIQWAGRQSLVDELSSIDPHLSDIFLKVVAGSLYRGSIHLKPNGVRRSIPHDGLRKGNPIKIPASGLDMMAHPSVINMEAKAFEKLLMEYLCTLPNVHRHIGSIRLGKQDSEGNYAVEGQGVSDLIVIAEGANSATRSQLGIHTFPVVHERLQIAGAIGIDSGGVMIKHWRNENGNIFLTGVMGRNGVEKTWLVADVDIEKITNFQSQCRDQQLIEAEFRRLAAASLELPMDRVQTLKIYGAVDGLPITPFVLQQKIADTAALGNNVILMGDAVGTGHWSVGGGMQIGAISHAERLKTLLFEIEMGIPRKQALQKYSDAVLSDTIEWCKMGISDSYPTIERESGYWLKSCITHPPILNF